jgi:quinolinate synthase
MPEAELRIRIASAKAALAGRLVILGHHYQQDAVIDFADFTGDSFELSRKAAEQKNAEFVVFCGIKPSNAGINSATSARTRRLCRSPT